MTETPDTLEAIASRWFARKRSGEMTPAQAAELEAWLAADPEHRALYDQAEYWWGAANALRGDPQILKLREEVTRARPRPPRRLWLGGAMAASIAAAAFGGWQATQAGLIPTPAALFTGEQTFRTGVGQTATVRLRDGSVVTLDTDTLLRAREIEDARLIRLARGQAYFKVAKDRTRPFRVAAGGKVVTALGTAFSVRVQKDAVEVTLVEGRVRVEEAAPAPRLSAAAPPPPGEIAATEMKPGSRLVALEDKGWVLRPVDTGKATSWLDGQLIFEERPLGEVAAELNRYSERKIVIADVAVARTPITGAFATGDVDAFVSAVRSYRLAAVTSESRKEVELGAAE